MNWLERVILAVIPKRDTHTPAHGCVAAAWVWVVFAVLGSAAVLAVAHCAAAVSP